MGKLAHLAATYAAVNAIAVLACPEAYDIIDRYHRDRKMRIQSLLRGKTRHNAGYAVQERYKEIADSLLT